LCASLAPGAVGDVPDRPGLGRAAVVAGPNRAWMKLNLVPFKVVNPVVIDLSHHDRAD
jgi:hypothetical protein